MVIVFISIKVINSLGWRKWVFYIRKVMEFEEFGRKGSVELSMVV